MSVHHFTAAAITFGLRDIPNTRAEWSLNARLNFLDEEAHGFAGSSGDDEFDAASYAYRRSDDDQAKWDELVTAAEHLATFLEPHGTCDAIIIRGRCTSSFGHLDDGEARP